MGDMFGEAGESATTWSVTIPETNGNNICNGEHTFFGETQSTNSTPPTDRFFTLAQNQGICK